MAVDVVGCETARELMAELDPGNKRWTNEKNHWRSGWVFRGQADHRWVLMPAAFRNGSSDSFMLSTRQHQRKTVLKNEQTYLHIFEQKFEGIDREHLFEMTIQFLSEISNLRRFFELADKVNLNSAIPAPSEFYAEGSKTARMYFENFFNSDYVRNFWGLPAVAIAQHHGVPTRLLDWTWHPLYAAYFACQGIPDDASHIVIYAIHSFDLDHSDFQLVEVRKGLSQYIHAQEGIFTVDTKADEHFLQYGNWRPMLDPEKPELTSSIGDFLKFTLPVSEVPELVRLLWLNRVTRAHMMPSLDNVVEAMKYQTRWIEQHGENQ